MVADQRGLEINGVIISSLSPHKGDLSRRERID
jgi:hypothetical protein